LSKKAAYLSIITNNKIENIGQNDSARRIAIYFLEIMIERSCLFIVKYLFFDENGTQINVTEDHKNTIR
jgi:hypothetical protein